ncbi:hypothetical protein GVO57_13990 (plasmid) [Sphingomonas changnyeongensis]|uniref:DUF3142 domain-containing protein n=1 Tax=Sphingomonas changnyeongensis TaxID=2698679 RepID=A0A7Z2NYZ5_9SPHN|nr:hypothetical protein [Sphingomonas changnyeongensis]QHL92004.1 hypothetical protein GVO57_13990 [Sphingomonas changnyeongensis]
MRCHLLLPLLALAACQPAAPAPEVVVWAWERPEDLRFLPKDAEIAVQTGFIDLAGDNFLARGRRFPLRADRPPTTAVVHIQIDDSMPLRWTPALRARVSAAVLHFARIVPAPRVQIDFEVRQSQRQVLIDVLHDVRAGLPRTVLLSMTAIASWCQEDWLGALPVDEIVPMLFRMGRGGAALRARIEGGGDFAEPACRKALAVSSDAPIARAPPGRRIYMFAPQSWTPSTFDAVRKRVEQWR